MSLDASLDLLRRLPPSKTAHNLTLLQSLLPEDITAELLQSIDQPLATRTCTKTGREYLLCDYNRDGDSYRSPWSGEWEPKIDDPVVLDEGIRELEVKANDAFDSYRDLYSVLNEDVMLIAGIMRAVYRAFICGIWMMVLLGLFCSRNVCLRFHDMC